MRLLFAVALTAVLAIGALWWAAYHVPGWYEPVSVPQARLDQVRADAVGCYNRFGDGLVRRSRFEWVFDERQVSEWIAARERIWPDSDTWIPAWVHDPIVRFREGSAIVAARVDLDRRELIVGAHLRVEIGGDDILVVRLVRVTAGSLPVPLGMLGDALARLLRLEGHDLDLVPTPLADVAQRFRESEPAVVLSAGLRRANRFIWENGRRPYRISGLKIDEGKLTLTVEPL